MQGTMSKSKFDEYCAKVEKLQVVRHSRSFTNDRGIDQLDMKVTVVPPIIRTAVNAGQLSINVCELTEFRGEIVIDLRVLRY